MNRLFIDKIISVGAVPEGDDPAATITFFKASPHGEEHTTPDRGTDDEREDRMDFDLSALDEEIAKSVSEHVAALEARITELEAASVEPETDTDILKTAPDEVRELVAKQQEQIADLAKALEAQAAEKRDAEFVAKAADLGILGDPDEVGPVLGAIADAAPDAWGQLEAMLTAVAQRSDLGEVFKEYGRNEPTSDPMARRDAYVVKQRDLGDKRPVDELRAEFWAENRDAVRALREEQQ